MKGSFSIIPEEYAAWENNRGLVAYAEDCPDASDEAEPSA